MWKLSKNKHTQMYILDQISHEENLAFRASLDISRDHITSLLYSIMLSVISIVYVNLSLVFICNENN